MLIVRREYLERVRTKSFLITTLLMPVILIGIMLAPTLVMLFSGPSERNIAVVDRSGLVAPALTDTEEITFTPTPLPVDSAKNDERYDAVLVIGPDIMTNTADLTFYSHESTGMSTEMAITGQVEDIIEAHRLKEYNINNLSEIIDAVHADCRMRTVRIGDEEGTQNSSMVSYTLGLFMTFILYMFIILYGQMVMTSIIEEKNNRVLEVVVSSVKPATLMCGKVVGIGCVAATQILIWAALICSFVTWGMPVIISHFGESAAADMDLMSMFSLFTDTGYIMSLFGWMTAFLIAGYMFYCGIYAAIGSSVDNIQDAAQLQSLAMVPVILAFVLSFTATNDPDSALAVTLSMIPFTSPLVMLTRIPYGIPVWQPIVSLAILVVSIAFMLWLSAKIYRVGIFMYGKKPTVKDLIRWATYK